MSRVVRVFVLPFLLCTALVNAQEPNHVLGATSARFPQKTGYFHEVGPCKLGDLYKTPAVRHPDAPDALCFGVVAVRLGFDGKKITYGEKFSGTLMIAQTEVRFLPQDPAKAALEHHFDPKTIQFMHPPGQRFANMGDKEFAYAVAYIDNCYRCEHLTATPEEVMREAHDEEFDLIFSALHNFSPTFARVNEIAHQLPIAVGPAYEPKPEDGPGRMKIYAALNHSLAGICPAQAVSCVKSYETYQSCRASGTADQCGSAPACTATCTVSKEPDFAMIEFPVRDDGGPVHLVPFEEGPPTLAQLTKTSHPGGPGEMTYTSVMGPIPIPHVAAQTTLLKSVQPIYPPVARAAHITGTVVLHAIIDEQGDVESLDVVSGPQMLQGSAIAAAKQWKYRPYLLDGKAVKVDTQIVLNYNLDGKGPAPADAK